MPLSRHPTDESAGTHRVSTLTGSVSDTHQRGETMPEMRTDNETGVMYRQWNAAFDAGTAVALGKSLITLHDEALDHALKEVDAGALATTRNVEQVVELLAYVTKRPF